MAVQMLLIFRKIACFVHIWLAAILHHSNAKQSRMLTAKAGTCMHSNKKTHESTIFNYSDITSAACSKLFDVAFF